VISEDDIDGVLARACQPNIHERATNSADPEFQLALKREMRDMAGRMLLLSCLTDEQRAAWERLRESFHEQLVMLLRMAH